MAKHTAKLQNIGSWLKEGLTYVVENWQMLLRVYLWVMLVYFGTALLVGLVVGIFLGISKVAGSSMVGVISMVLMVIAGIVGLILILAMVGKMTYFQTKAAMQPIKSIRKEWKSLSWKEGLGIYGLLILMALAMYGGLILLIIPGFVVMTMISMALFIKVEQGIGGLKALMLSRDYVKGYGWAIFGRWTLNFVIMLPVWWLIYDLYSKMIQAGGAVAVLGFLIYMVIMALFSFWMYRLGYLLYKNLVDIKGKLAVKANGLRTTGWILLMCAPILVTIITVTVLAAVNPKAQIEKAKNEAIQKQLLRESPLPSIKPLVK